MAKVSVIIPSRNEIFLQKTVEDLFNKASGEIEVIVILEGYWPDPQLRERNNLIIIHHGQPQGMRQAINAAAAIAKGDYLMKTDAHCLFAEGFDETLKADCGPDWVCIPRRYSLDAERWERKDKAPVDYMYLSFPDDPNDFGGAGYHGREWKEKNRDETLQAIEIDDAMSFQGSCWFMPKDWFYHLDLMDCEHWGTFWQEAQEIGPKCWFAGGRVVRNKKTFYAHLHKGHKYGRGYFLDKRTTKNAVAYSNKFLGGEVTWPKQKPGRDLKWLIEKFWPVPGWPEEWGPGD